MAFNQELLNYQTRIANGCIDTRTGAYDSGERGYYASCGYTTHQSRVDRHNDYVYRQNNGDFPDCLHGNSAVTVRSEEKSTVKKARKRFLFW